MSDPKFAYMDDEGLRYSIGQQVMDYESVIGYTLRISRGDELLQRRHLDKEIVEEFIKYIKGEVLDQQQLDDFWKYSKLNEHKLRKPIVVEDYKDYTGNSVG